MNCFCVSQVSFENEAGQDEGGVRKEFFMLLMRDLTCPDYGMFSEFPESRLVWFNEFSLEGSEQFYLIGGLCLQMKLKKKIIKKT